MTKHNKFLQKIKTYMLQFFVKEDRPPWQLFWTLFMYSKFQLEISDYDAQAFFIIGLLFAIVCRNNHFYLYSPILNAGLGCLSILNLLFGIFGSNQKCKFYLFLFIIGDSVCRNYPQANNMYLISSSLLISYSIYTKFIFFDVQANIAFFVGFATVAILSIIQIILESLNLSKNLVFALLPIIIYSMYLLIKQKFTHLERKNLQELKDPQIIYQFINIFQKKLNTNLGQKTQIIYNHEIKCQNIQCQCKYDKAKNEVNNYKMICSLYESVLLRLNKQDQNFIFQRYIAYKLKNQQVTKAIILNSTNKYGTFNIFRKIQRIKNIFKIKKIIRMLQEFGDQTIKIQNLLQYDKYYIQLIQKIKKIIESKIRFWFQVGKNEPHLASMQEKGLNLIDDTQQLHYFFQEKIQPLQKKFNFFAGTIIYAIYLQGTTNYKQHGNGLIREVIRSLDCIKFSKQKINQTFVLQLKLVTSFNTPINQISNQGNFKQFNLLVNNASSTCCKFLKIPRNKLINCSVNQIIPSVYVDKHHAALKRIMSENAQKKLDDYIFLGKKNFVPVKLANQELVSVRVRITISPNSKNQLYFLCVIERLYPEPSVILLDFEGRNLTKQNSIIQSSIILNQKTQIELFRIYSQYSSSKKIQKITYFLELQTRYQVTLSSPFINKFQSGTVPIHLQYSLTNQNQQNQKQKQQKIAYFIEKLNENLSVIQNDQLIGSNTVNKNNNLVNLLTQFQNNHSIVFFRKYMISFVLIIALGVILIFLSSKTMGLEWDNSIQEFNPVKNIKTIYSIQRQIIHLMSRSQDIEAFKNGKNDIDDMKISFTDRQIAVKAIVDWGPKIQKILSQNIAEKMSYKAAIFDENFNNYLKTQIQIINPGSLNPNYKTQKLSLRNILKNYLTDVHLLINGKNFTETLFPFSYLYKIHPLLQQFQDQNRKIMEESINKTLNINIILLILFIIVMTITLIPIFYFRKNYHKNIEKLFDLIISIKSTELQLEININLNLLASMSQSTDISQSVDVRTLKQINLMQENSETPKYLFDQNQKGNELSQQMKFLSYQKHDRLRKREGQLINQHRKDYTTYILIGIILIIVINLGIIQGQKYKMVLNVFHQANTEIQSMKKLASMSYLMANTKCYLYQGDSKINDQMLLSQLIDREFNKYMDNINNPIFPPNPTDIISKNLSSAILLETQQRSLQLIDGLFILIIGHTYRAIKIGSPQPGNFKRAMIYAQTLSQNAQISTLQKTNQYQTQQSTKFSNIQLQVNIQFQISLILCALGLFIGIYLIQKLKNLYVKQITMISFLNLHMIAHNKRIQSFLQRISKGVQ